MSLIIGCGIGACFATIEPPGGVVTANTYVDYSGNTYVDYSDNTYVDWN